MKIIVNNFFKGILKRGIPIYTSELVSQLKEKNINVIEITCPKWAKNIHPFLLNILFVCYEQIFIPLLGVVKRTNKNIYPYNSCSFIDVLLKKDLIIVHDFISLKRNTRKLSAYYVRLSILFSSLFCKNIIFISDATLKTANRLGLFKSSNKFILPNPFFSFERKVFKYERIDNRYILLISGVGENKDLSTALDYYKNSNVSSQLQLKILGCGNNKDYVYKMIKDKLIDNLNIDVIDFISLNEAVKLYRESTFIWAHSLREGYGRAIAEAKLSSKNVLCTNIPSFIEQKDLNVYIYSDYNTFCKQLQLCLDKCPLNKDVTLHEHVIFNSNLNNIIDLIRDEKENTDINA